MAFTYRQVKDLHDTLAEAGVVTDSLPAWAQQMNAQSGSDLYGAGLQDNIFKRLSVGIDRGLESIPGLVSGAGDLGAAFGGLFGQEEAGRGIGEGLPRMTANFLPIMAAGAVTGGLAFPAAIAGAAGTGLLSGAQTYTETGSPGAGVLSGVTAAALPWATGKIEQGILSKLGAREVSGGLGNNWRNIVDGDISAGMYPTTVEQTKRFFPTNFGQSLAAGAAGQVGAAGIMEASNYGQDVLAGRPLHDPFTAENALNLTLGQAPFAVLHLASKLSGGKSPMQQADLLESGIKSTQRALDLKKAVDMYKEQSDVSKIPDLTPEQRQANAQTLADTEDILSNLGKRKQDIEANPTTENVGELGRIKQERDQVVQDSLEKTGGVGMGTTKVSGPNSAKLSVVGEDHYFGNKQGDPAKGFHIITVAEDEANAGLKYPDASDVKAGDRIQFPAGQYDPAVNRDSTNPNFLVPYDKFTKITDKGQQLAKAVVGGKTQQPNLPEQPKAFDVQQFSDRLTTLDKIEQNLSQQAALSYGDTVDALTQVNNVRAAANLPEIDLASLISEIKKRKIKSNKEGVLALLNETRAMQLAEQAAHADKLVAVQNEVDIQGRLHSEADMGDVNSQRILDLYESLSGESGRRGEIATSGLFWQKARELDAKGQLSYQRMKGWSEGDVVAQGKGLKKDKLVTEKELPGPAFQALKSDEAAVVQLVAQEALRLTTGNFLSDDVKVFRRMAINGNLTGGREAIEEAAIESGVADSPFEAKDFAEQFIKAPHVQDWIKGIGDLVKQNEAPRLNAPREMPSALRPAGGPFVFGLAPYDSVSNRLGDKHTLPKSSEIKVEQLKAIGGRGKPLQDVEIEMMKAVDKAMGGGAFDEKGNVNVRKLDEVLKKNPVQVEVKKLGEGANDPKRQRLAELVHWLDTNGYKIEGDDYFGADVTKNGESIKGDQAPKEVQEFLSLNKELDPDNSDSDLDGGKYSFLGPKSESEMPGYVEGLVRVPTKKDHWENPTGLKYSGPHFGGEDHNVLAFFRGYEETLPDGQKAFHVIEVQSDWAQNQRKLEESAKVHERARSANPEAAIPLARQKADAQAHPLLSAYETLALKAAIDHANSIGATKIILPDAETAMMTEGHDKAVSRAEVEDKGKWLVKFDDDTEQVFNTKEEADKAGGVSVNEILARPTQEGGMRLHYDTTLPSAMRKLTGDSGERVDLGTHKSASRSDLIEDRFPTKEAAQQFLGYKKLEEPNVTFVLQNGRYGEFEVKRIEGSPVFRNPDGTPKSSITGTVYDLSKAKANLESQGGFTLGDPTRAPKPLDPFIPQFPEDAAVVQALTGNGHDILRPILASADPREVQLAKYLMDKFPEQLNLIESKVADGINGAFAQRKATDRGVSITFGPGNVTGPEFRRNATVLHEVIHALTTNEINTLPPGHPLIKELESIRKRAIDALPKSMRERYNAAVKSDWYTRNSSTEDNLNHELASDPREFQILYSLLNNDEFVAQTFTSHDVRSYLKSVPGKASAWKGFTGWVKNLLHFENLSPDTNTAFDNVLEVSHQLMDRGEYLAGMQKFGEQWFESQGKGGMYGKSQTQRALGLVQGSDLGTSSIELRMQLAEKEGRFNPQFTKAKRNLDNMLAQQGDDYQQVAAILSENNHSPSTKGINDFLETSLQENRDIGDELDLMPQTVNDYLFEKIKDHQDVLEMLAAATAQKNKKTVNILDPKLLRGPVAETLKGYEQVLEHQARHIEMAQDLVGLAGVDPAETSNMAMRAPKQFDDFMEGGKSILGKAARGIGWFLEPPGQLARSAPESAEIISKGFQLSPNIRKMFSEIVKVFGMDTKADEMNVLTHESVKQSEHVFSTPKLLDKVDRWIHRNQVEGKDAVGILPDSHPEVAKLLVGLSPKDKEAVIDGVNKQSLSVQMMHAQILEKMTQVAAVNGGGVALSEGGKAKDAVALADTLLRAAIDMSDPMKTWQAQAAIETVRGKMTADGFLSLLKYVSMEAEKIGMAKESFDKNKAWATAQRQEQFLIRGTKNGKAWTNQASSVTEAKAKAEKFGVRLNKENGIIDQWKGHEDEPFAFPNVTPEMVARMEQLEENQIQMLKDKGILVGEDAEKEFRRTSTVTQVLREATGNQKIEGINAPARLLSQGAEDLPWMWNHISYAQRQSSYWSRQLLRAQARTYLRDPELASNEALRSQLSTHFENMLHPDPVLAQKMTKFAATWFMGFNLASTLINAAQPFTTHVAELTSMSGRPVDSYRRVLNALKEAGGRMLGKKEWATELHAWAMEKAAQDGERSLSMWDDDALAQESIAANHKRAMMKDKAQSIGQRLESAAGTYSTVGMWLFKHGEQLNSTAALLAGLDYYTEQGLGREDALAKAYEFNHAVNFSGGRAQRPVGAFSGRGVFPRSVAMLGTSLQSYVLGTTFQIARYLQKGAFRPQGLTPHEVYAARKAAVQMLGTQFAAAGLLGMPFVSGAIAILNQAFPDLELNRKIRGGVTDFLSSDKEQGSVLSDIAMTGVPSMLGWDMQSRLSMGNTLPGVSEINGFQPENLMGPVGNIVKNFVNGVSGWSKGDPSSTMAFLPPAIKKTVQAGQSLLADGGAIRDYQGRPLASPTRGEQLGQLLGFQPKRLSDQNAAAHIATQATEVVNRQKAQENQQMAEEVLKGNFGTVRQSLLSKARDDKSYNPVDAVRSIARAAEDLTFPRDLRREGNLGTSSVRQSLLSSYSNLAPTTSASEVERLQFRAGIEQKLGLPPVRLGRELQEAQMMDQLKAAKPEATRSELRAAVQLALRRSGASSQMLSSSPE